MPGKLAGLGFEEVRDEAQLNAMTDNVVKSSDIEGEHLPQDRARSSIARQLGMKHTKNLVRSCRVVNGMVGTDDRCDHERWPPAHPQTANALA